MYDKFDRDISVLIMPWDILSIPEDEYYSYVFGPAKEETIKMLKMLRNDAMFKKKANIVE